MQYSRREAVFSRVFVKCLIIAVAAAAAAYATNPPTHFDGYVTNVVSATEFDVGTCHVVRNPSTRWIGSEAAKDAQTAAQIRVGLHVHVEGVLDKKTGALLARKIKILRDEKPEERMSGTGLIQLFPRLHRDETGSTGTIWVDGYPLELTPQTALVGMDGRALTPDQIRTNFWADYQATRLSDGTITAQRISLRPNTVDESEKEFLNKFRPRITRPDDVHYIPATIRLPGLPALDLVSDEAINGYVKRVGDSLIPEYQKDLPASDPTKVNFRFFVVQPDTAAEPEIDHPISYPNGVILIPEHVLTSLDNEAQLSALLGRCIAYVLQKEHYLHRKQLLTDGLVSAAASVPFGFPAGAFGALKLQRALAEMNSRAERVGLTYMLMAGYDLREAPFAWDAAANRPVENPQIRVKPSGTAKRLMEDLRLDYSMVDYAGLKVGRDSYKQAIRELQEQALPAKIQSSGH